MKIINIKTEDRYFKEIINIYYNWFSKEKYKYEEFYNKYKEILISEKLPSLNALIINDTLIGVYELNEKDGIDSEKYTPYLANVFIKEKYRNQGYSKILIEDAISKTEKLGYKTLYLHSRHENYYEKFGFKFFKEVDTKTSTKRIFKYQIKGKN